MIIEKLNTGRDFVDDEGNVRHMSDLTADMEVADFGADSAATHAARGLTRSARARHNRRRLPEISGQDIANMIQYALEIAEAQAGQELTDAQVETISRRTEAHARSIS